MRRWLIGIDAGGTGTRCLAAAEDGARRRSEAGPCNWTTQSAAACLGAVDAAVADLRLERGDAVEAVCLCSAGFYRPHHGETVEAALAERWPAARRLAETDLAGAWAGALALAPGVVVIAGTGSVAYGRDVNGSETRAGGWGPLFGDEGSGYWLACRALNAVSRATDGRSPETVLAERLLASLPHSPVPLPHSPTEHLRAFLRRAPAREEVAALAPRVLEAATQGDAVAAALQREAAAELAALARAVEAALAPAKPLPWSWSGGLLCGSAALRERVQACLVELGSALAPRPPLHDAAGGALLLAGEALGAGPRCRELAKEPLR